MTFQSLAQQIPIIFPQQNEKQTHLISFRAKSMQRTQDSPLTFLPAIVILFDYCTQQTDTAVRLATCASFTFIKILIYTCLPNAIKS